MAHHGLLCADLLLRNYSLTDVIYCLGFELELSYYSSGLTLISVLKLFFLLPTLKLTDWPSKRVVALLRRALLGAALLINN